MSSKRVRLDIAYDGRGFDGWQSQPSGNTIQDTLLSAIQSICAEVQTVQGSGRTDAGVCAYAQTAHFDAPEAWRMDEVAWRKALNARLPSEVRIVESALVDEDFHSRFSAVRKTYRYRIWLGEVLSPFELGLAWHQPRLDAEAMQQAMAVYLGEHDFRMFSANRNDGKDATRDTVREIYAVESRLVSPELLEIDITGNGFLYKMVRFLIGVGSYIAAGRVSQEEVRMWLSEPCNLKKSPFCAPVGGLFLKKVYY